MLTNRFYRAVLFDNKVAAEDISWLLQDRSELLKILEISKPDFRFTGILPKPGSGWPMYQLTN
jgi:hypothetical protein